MSEDSNINVALQNFLAETKRISKILSALANECFSARLRFPKSVVQSRYDLVYYRAVHCEKYIDWIHNYATLLVVANAIDDTRLNTLTEKLTTIQESDRDILDKIQTTLPMFFT
jgi:hypothetical protein